MKPQKMPKEEGHEAGGYRRVNGRRVDRDIAGCRALPLWPILLNLFRVSSTSDLTGSLQTQSEGWVRISLFRPYHVLVREISETIGSRKKSSRNWCLCEGQKITTWRYLKYWERKCIEFRSERKNCKFEVISATMFWCARYPRLLALEKNPPWFGAFMKVKK